MIQQITNTRTNKQLTIDDLGRIAFVSCLNFFHTNSMFKPCPFGIRPSIRTYYVKRINKNEYQLQICYANTAVTDNTSAPLQMDKNCGKLTTQTLSQIQELHPDLSSDKNGDERVLIIYFYYPFYFDKSKLGLFLLYPKPAYLSWTSSSDIILGNFVYNLVISPKPGLFPILSK